MDVTSCPLPVRAARLAARGLLFALLVCTPLAAQTLPPVARSADLSGPRFGVTLLNETLVDELAARGVHIDPVVSQFGWQVEHQFFADRAPITMVTECVLLMGGLEQGVALPSLNWLVGLRTQDGAEFGLGPNLTPAGPALVFAAGRTFRAGAVNIPVNVAVVPSPPGMRISVLTGFSLRRR